MQIEKKIKNPDLEVLWFFWIHKLPAQCGRAEFPPSLPRALSWRTAVRWTHGLGSLRTPAKGDKVLNRSEAQEGRVEEETRSRGIVLLSGDQGCAEGEDPEWTSLNADVKPAAHPGASHTSNHERWSVEAKLELERLLPFTSWPHVWSCKTLRFQVNPEYSKKKKILQFVSYFILLLILFFLTNSITILLVVSQKPTSAPLIYLCVCVCVWPACLWSRSSVITQSRWPGQWLRDCICSVPTHSHQACLLLEATRPVCLDP